MRLEMRTGITNPQKGLFPRTTFKLGAVQTPANTKERHIFEGLEVLWVCSSMGGVRHPWCTPIGAFAATEPASFCSNDVGIGGGSRGDGTIWISRSRSCKDHADGWTAQQRSPAPQKWRGNGQVVSCCSVYGVPTYMDSYMGFELSGEQGAQASVHGTVHAISRTAGVSGNQNTSQEPQPP